jgi:hypothetical protein
MVSHCACPTRGVRDRALHEHRRPSSLPPILTFSLGEWPRLPFTARIERAHSYRARSANKKGTWPLLPYLILWTESGGIH